MSEPAAGPRPPHPPASPPAAPAGDEISLRELYLVLRRRLPWIAALALIGGAGAFAALSLQAARYEAEATAVVARVPVSVPSGSGFAFQPQLDVTYETYTALAYSRDVLEAVLDAAPGAELALDTAREALALERLAGAANQPSALLAVAHRASAADPELAAALATRWAEVTVDAVRDLLTENLDAVARITRSELEVARADLAAAEEALRVFRESSDANVAPERLAGAYRRAVALAERRDEVWRLRAAREVELASLADVADAGVSVVLAEAPDAVLTVEGARLALAARIAALGAELTQLQVQETALAAEIVQLSAAVATFEATVASLERAVTRADADVAALAAIEPSVAYVAQLAPTSPRLLGEAAVPTTPVGRPTLLVTLLAVVVVGFGGAVAALLAEAVRDPSSPRA